jgi:hypothetical protein
VKQTKRIHLTLSPEAERYARRDAPVQVRRMAALGALPLPPVELATVLFVLVHDPDGEVKERARKSLEELPEGACEAVLSGPTHPEVLSYLVHVFAERPERLERIALNAQASDATIAHLASLPNRRIVDIIANNQERMLRCPDIVEALGSNPLTGRAVIDRILSFLGLSRPEAEVSEEPELESPPPPEALSDAEAAAALRAFLGDDVSHFARELVDDETQLEEEARENLFAAIQDMSVMQKIKLARMGNKEARGLLVRDRNKIVAAAAIRSPKLTDQEIVSFAKARNIADEVLRIIASNREWTRNYQVKLALATNPKCPQSSAMKFLNYLQDRELRGIMRSKDVPSVIANHARRILGKKGKL